MKIKLSFYCHTSLRCLIKPFEAPQRSVNIKILIFSIRPGLGREGFNKLQKQSPKGVLLKRCS